MLAVQAAAASVATAAMGNFRWHAVELENEAGGEVATAGGVQEAEPRKNPSKSSQPSLRLSSDAMMAAY